MRTLLILTALLLASCQSTPEQPVVIPNLTFDTQPPVVFEAVDSQWQSNTQYNGSATQLRAQPLQLDLAQWASQRLAVSGFGNAKLIIQVEQAELNVVELTVDESWLGAFKNQEEQRVESQLKLSLQLVDPLQRVIAGSNIAVSRSRGVLEHATLGEQKMVAFEVVEDTFAALDSELQKQIQSYWQPYLRISQ